jgi:hypothetical protein
MLVYGKVEMVINKGNPEKFGGKSAAAPLRLQPIPREL